MSVYVPREGWTPTGCFDTHDATGWTVHLTVERGLWFAMSPHGVDVRPSHREGWHSLSDARAAVEGLIAGWLRISYDLERGGTSSEQFGRTVLADPPAPIVEADGAPGEFWE